MLQDVATEIAQVTLVRVYIYNLSTALSCRALAGYKIYIHTLYIHIYIHIHIMDTVLGVSVLYVGRLDGTIAKPVASQETQLHSCPSTS